jgi:uncharacterized membrane protein YhhN
MNRKIEVFAKPLAMLFLIIWGLVLGIERNLFETNLLYFIVGLLLCLVGDIFLLLPPKKFFMPGLVAFLMGHISYILGFGLIEDLEKNIIPIFVLAVVIVTVSWQIGTLLVQSLRTNQKNKLIIPIIIYSVVISVMLFLAGLRFFDPDWTTTGAFFVSIGAVLFFFSDVLNAWERFVNKFKHDRLFIMILYHLGQYGIGIGAVFHFAGIFPR